MDPKKHPNLLKSPRLQQFVYSCLENNLLFIFINFTPETSQSCLRLWYFPMFSRWYFWEIRQVRVLMAKMGFRNMDELIGHAEAPRQILG